MTSAVARVLAQGEQKQYFMGWVAAYHSANVVGDNVFYLEERKKSDEVHFSTKIFKTQKGAEGAIKKAYPAEHLKDGSKIAVRKYVYETHIPKHAKFMPEWTEADSTKWIFVEH